MKKIIAASLVLTSILSQFTMASNYQETAKRYFKDAVDLLYKPQKQIDWTGFYAGANLGFGWSTQSIYQSSTNPSLTSTFSNNAVPRILSSNPSGFLGGIQGGYSYQLSRTVLGVEADYQVANIEDSTTNTSSKIGFPKFSSTARQSLNSLGSLRARLGFSSSFISTNDLLLFVSAGFGYGRAEMSGKLINPGCTGFCGDSTSSNNMTGWVAGGGFEYRFDDAWSAKAEYLYYDLGGQSQNIYDPSQPGGPLVQKTNFEGNLIRIGLNYLFM